MVKRALCNKHCVILYTVEGTNVRGLRWKICKQPIGIAYDYR